MKKIEQQMVAAVQAVALNTITAWSSGNTSVASCDEGVEVRLHGNLIARFHVPVYTSTIARWEWTLAGWNTNTTRSRINALRLHFGGRYATTVHGQPYAYSIADGRVMHREPIAADAWVSAALIDPASAGLRLAETDMTVAELIDYLQQHPGDTPVVLRGKDMSPDAEPMPVVLEYVFSARSAQSRI